jgi:uncharacterized OsmC-like protein
MNVNAQDIANAPRIEGTVEEVRRETAKRQNELMARYRDDPEAAWVIDTAETCSTGDSAREVRHGKVAIGHGAKQLDFATHAGVGGPGDGPVSGDILAAALATCMDNTIRLISSRLRVELSELSVHVEALCDLRGTMCVDADVPVGFQRMDVAVRLRAAPGTDPSKVEMLLAATEHCCVVLRTLRAGVPIDLASDVG